MDIHSYLYIEQWIYIAIYTYVCDCVYVEVCVPLSASVTLCVSLCNYQKMTYICTYSTTDGGDSDKFDKSK